MSNRVAATAGVIVVIAAVVAAIAGPGEPGAACLPAACDCEAVGAGPIRQPWNAWSSLALAAAGIWVLGSNRSMPERLVGGAAIGSGIAAFLKHAVLTSWSAPLDGIGIAALTGALASAAWSDRVKLPVSVPVVAAATGGAALAGTGVLSVIGVAFGGLAAAGILRRCRGGSIRLLAVAAVLLAAGGVLWLLGRSDGPWCFPDGPIVHAGWHLLAAAALIAGWEQLRRCSA